MHIIKNTNDDVCLDSTQRICIIFYIIIKLWDENNYCPGKNGNHGVPLVWHISTCNIYKNLKNRDEYNMSIESITNRKKYKRTHIVLG